jgi:hypothetical protein
MCSLTRVPCLDCGCCAQWPLKYTAQGQLGQAWFILQAQRLLLCLSEFFAHEQGKQKMAVANRVQAILIVHYHLSRAVLGMAGEKILQVDF